jgi:hypothetical protein
MLEWLYPAGVFVENTHQVWEISRWRGATEFTNWFLRVGYGPLPQGAPVMFRLKEVHSNHDVHVIALLSHFTNLFDAFHLLGQVH